MSAFSGDPRALCARFLAETDIDVDSLAEEIRSVWSRAVQGLSRPSKQDRSRFRPTRLAIREILQILCRAGSRAACTHRRETLVEWWRIIGMKPAQSTESAKEFADPDDFHVRQRGDAPYPILPGQTVEEELASLLTAYRDRKGYAPSSREITLGLYRMLNEGGSLRNGNLLACVNRWLGGCPAFS